MAITAIGMNFTAINNITAPVLNITSNQNTLIDTIHNTANTATNGYLTILILIAVTLFFYIVTTDKSGLTDFGYSDLKGLIIAFGMASIIGLVGVEAGIYQSFKSVVAFIILFMLMLIFSSFNSSGAE